MQKIINQKEIFIFMKFLYETRAKKLEEVEALMDNAAEAEGKSFNS